jgi:hypothetical protein
MNVFVGVAGRTAPEIRKSHRGFGGRPEVLGGMTPHTSTSGISVEEVSKRFGDA